MQTIKLYLYNQNCSSKQKIKNHKVINSKLRIDIVIARNFSIYIACYHMKIDVNRAF